MNILNVQGLTDFVEETAKKYLQPTYVARTLKKNVLYNAFNLSIINPFEILKTSAGINIL